MPAPSRLTGLEGAPTGGSRSNMDAVRDTEWRAGSGGAMFSSRRTVLLGSYFGLLGLCAGAARGQPASACEPQAAAQGGFIDLRPSRAFAQTDEGRVVESKPLAATATYRADRIVYLS